MKKKVAILTLNGNWNYGNKLQNYALKKQIENLGYQVNTLWFIEKKFYIKELIKKIIPTKKYSRYRKFKNFSKKELNIKHYQNKKIEDSYEYFIVGSDQVWNPNFGLEEDLRFLSFSKNKTKIAFSASFGVNSIPQELYKLYKKGIDNLDYISVRENAGKRIIEKITERTDVEILVDPTMLLNQSDWQQISKKPKKKIKEKYILNYFLGNLSEERKTKIYNYANKKDWKIINILDKQDPFYTSGPSEFIYLEEHAELICTDSFHSCVFGILMGTPFIVFDREDKEEKMNSRIDTLLSKFKLEDRRFNGEINDNKLKIDYSKAYEILKQEKIKATNFLKKSLNHKKEVAK